MFNVVYVAKFQTLDFQQHMFKSKKTSFFFSFSSVKCALMDIIIVIIIFLVLMPLRKDNEVKNCNFVPNVFLTLSQITADSCILWKHNGLKISVYCLILVLFYQTIILFWIMSYHKKTHKV